MSTNNNDINHNNDISNVNDNKLNVHASRNDENIEKISDRNNDNHNKNNDNHNNDNHNNDINHNNNDINHNNNDSTDSHSILTASVDSHKLSDKSVVLTDVIKTTSRKKNNGISVRLTPDDIGTTYDDQSSTDTSDIILQNDAENRANKKSAKKTKFDSISQNKSTEEKMDVQGDIIAAEITTVSLPLSQPSLISSSKEEKNNSSSSSSCASSLPLSVSQENNVVVVGVTTRISKRKNSAANVSSTSASTSTSTAMSTCVSSCPIATVSIDKTDERERHKSKDENLKIERTKESVSLEIKEVDRNVRKARMRSPSNLTEVNDSRTFDNDSNNNMKIKKNDAWKKKDLISLSDVMKNEKGKNVDDDNRVSKKAKK